jgi:transposase
MSLHPQVLEPAPEETARIARAIFPEGNLVMRIRDELAGLYSDQDFADLFPARGHAAACPWRLAVVIVLQFLEGLTDRQAAEAVRTRIDWKYCLGLRLTDPGFHFTVLTGFRTRLVAGQAEHRLLTHLLERLRARGWLRARGRQRTDSTHVLAAVRTLNRLELVGETLRAALNRLTVAAPDWLRSQIDPVWLERYTVRVENSRLPKSDAEREALAAAVGADGVHLLQAALHPQAPAAVRAEPAVEALRRIWVQQYYAPDEAGAVRWRAAKDVPPPERWIHSPYDLDARFSLKRGLPWVGYKVHLTETCDEDTPHLIIHVATTPATVQDDAVTDQLHGALAAADLLPTEHLVDAGYTTAEHLVGSRDNHGIDLLGPVAVLGGWQAREGNGFDQSQFTIDWATQTAICPQGKRSRVWEERANPKGKAGKRQIRVRFHHGDCRVCPCRAACTRRKTEGRSLTFLPRVEHEALQAARRRQATPEFRERYRLRAGVEATLCQAVRVGDARHSRYVGLARTHLQQLLTAAALNVVRILAWLDDVPRAPTRVSRWVALAM